MIKYRLLLVFALAAAPVVFLIGAGLYHLYLTGWLFAAWWPMALCLVAAYGLVWYWTRRRTPALLPAVGLDDPPLHWTARDRQAWAIVEQRIRESAAPGIDQLADARRYADEAFSLALAIAQVYHPGAADPFSHLTLNEIVTCAELAAEDLSRKVHDYAIGSHLLTVGQWRSLRQYGIWGQRAWDLSWLARLAIDPLKAGSQFVASKAGGSILSRVQRNVLAWFYTAYLHELGRYLIELNSGRLKVGAKRYRELLGASARLPPAAAANADESKKHAVSRPPAAATDADGSGKPGGSVTPAAAADTDESEKPAGLLTVAIVGSLNAGKSSLVNALLGEHRAAVDCVPSTEDFMSYELKTGSLPVLRLLDTPGYDAAESAARTALAAARQADVVLLVSPARTAARAADAAFLQRFQHAFDHAPALKRPPIVVLLSKADLLPPAAEWQPPYDWQRGTRAKEAAMRAAAETAQEQLGDFPIIPIATLPERNFNIQEELLPELVRQAPAAYAAAVLRLFQQEGITGLGSKTLGQVLNAGRAALQAVWAELKPR